jgi:hypothetical protein
MTRGQMKHLVRLKLKAYKGTLEEKYDDTDELVEAMLEEGHKEFARETLVLEAKDTSLTYSSANDGFTLPTDFIKVKYLEFESSYHVYSRMSPTSIEYVKNRRNEWKDLSDESAAEIGPAHYSIFNGYIVLDSETTTSPNLYYYKYDTAFSADTSSPGYDDEFHKYLVDFALWQLTGDDRWQKQWEFGILKQKRKRNKTENIQSRHIAF